jgi:hypothetical protein
MNEKKGYAEIVNACKGATDARKVVAVAELLRLEVALGEKSPEASANVNEILAGADDREALVSFAEGVISRKFSNIYAELIRRDPLITTGTVMVDRLIKDGTEKMARVTLDLYEYPPSEKSSPFCMEVRGRRFDDCDEHYGAKKFFEYALAGLEGTETTFLKLKDRLVVETPPAYEPVAKNEKRRLT